MKRTKLTIAGALIIMLMVSVSAAYGGEFTFTSGEDTYKSPELVYSVRPDPVYYAPSRYVEGYVTLELKVGITGNVESVKVLYRTSLLAVKSSVRAVEQWEFEPAELNGKPVASIVVYSVPFGYNLPIFANEDYNDRVIYPQQGGRIAQK